MIEAILKGCDINHRLPPTIITTSWWTGSKINQVLPNILDLLKQYPGSTIYIFNDQKPL